jgi:hypothetical protein
MTTRGGRGPCCERRATVHPPKLRAVVGGSVYRPNCGRHRLSASPPRGRQCGADAAGGVPERSPAALPERPGELQSRQAHARLAVPDLRHEGLGNGSTTQEAVPRLD